MSATPEQPNIYISQIPYLLPDRAMNAAYDIREKFGLASIGVEIVPLRFHSEKYLLARKQETDVDVAVAGVTTATYKDFAKDLRDFRTNPRVFLEVLKIIGGIGAQSEPLWTRMFRTHLQLAVGLGASYLAMHEEPTRLLQEHGQLEQWLLTDVLYGRKLGWGPADNRPEILSWNIHAIHEFIDVWHKKGYKNLVSILPTDTVLRNGQFSLGEAFEVLQPKVIQVGDYNPDGKIEKLAPGDGKYARELADLIRQSSRSNPGTIYTIEVGNAVDVSRSVRFVLDNWKG